MTFLIDEQLSPFLAGKLTSKGVAARHVAHTGLAGASDPEVWRYAFEHDMSVITMNAEDFPMLASASETHAGLIVVRRGGLSRDEQWAELEPVIDELLERQADLFNSVVEINGGGSFTIRSLPAS